MRTARSAALCAATLALSVPVSARAQASSVDQVLAALADVVRDRAKQVAARTIARNIETRLCKGTVELTLAPDPGVRVLRLGGNGNTCWRTSSCDADDVFVRSCRLVAGPLDVPLSDAYYLKSLSRDAVDFLIRMAARRLTADEYAKEAGLGELGGFVHAVLEQLGREKPRPEDLAAPTLALADALSPGLPNRTFKKLNEDGSAAKLAAAAATVAKGWVQDGCPYTGLDKDGNLVTGKACDKGRDDATWFFAPGSEACDAYASHRADRRGVFDALFVPEKDGAAAPLFAGRDQRCDDAYPRPKKGAPDPRAEVRLSCVRARLALNLHDGLVKLQCAGDETTADALRAVLRELGYVVGEQLVYRDAFVALAEQKAGAPIAQDAIDCVKPGAPDGYCELDGFLDAVARLDLRDLPREELAYGVRFLGLYAAAVGTAPAATAEWLGWMRADLDKVRGDPERAYHVLLHGSALGTDTRLKSPPVADLRSAAKDLLTLPTLGMRQRQVLLDASAQARLSLVRLLRAIQDDPVATGKFPEVVSALADFLSDLSKLANAASREVQAQSPRAGLAAADAEKAAQEAKARAVMLVRGSDAIAEVAAAVHLAADKDWVGLAMRASDKLVAYAPDRYEELASAVRFLRVLLSMYQAPSVEEAKGIFAATLQDEDSRERRYTAVTIDVTALLGGRAGAQRARTVADVTRTDESSLYGLYAPLGVQLAYDWAGVLLYPVDLGAYVVSTPKDDGGTTTWEDALRLGATIYARPWPATPIVVGVGSDYQPRRDGRDELRVFGAVSLELPLFTIK